jgi:hypothetical protein
VTEDEAHQLVTDLIAWRARGGPVWPLALLAVWDRAIVAVNDLKVKLHLDAERPEGPAT